MWDGVKYVCVCVYIHVSMLVYIEEGYVYCVTFPRAMLRAPTVKGMSPLKFSLADQ